MTEITFLDYARPALPSGTYTVTATQTIAQDQQPYTATRTFTVSGDRFTLPPSRVTAVFPPDGSLGEFNDALPHVVLDRPTLPWERHAGLPKADVPGPWLAVLLFTEAERPAPTAVRLADLAKGPAYFPAITPEGHQSPDDQVTVIDVPRELLAQLLPTPAELPYLAHVRRTGDGPDAAVVIGSRLPPAGARCTAHLVSVEGRYLASGFDLGNAPAVRLVTLASWRFACVAADQTFAHLVRDLAQQPSPYRLPDSGNAEADRYLRQGYVPVRHALRQGGSTISWYRGPFAPGPVTGAPGAGTLSADHLLTFHPDVGMFDAGYAAAWELGRLLALQSADFATTLYDWKRRRAQRRLRTQLKSAVGFPLTVLEIDDEMPATAAAWLARLALLTGVPPMYLIPADRLLPVETIRFVQVDAAWMHCLLDGAFSIGRLSAADAQLDREYPLDQIRIPVTGALIRSDVVSGYPGLLVDGFDGTGKRLDMLRKDLPSPGVMLCLFGGTVARLDIHQRPESLHFGVALPAEGHFAKSLRHPSGSLDPPLAAGPMPLGPGGRLPVFGLAAAMATTLGGPALGPGDFARQMIETAERVSFVDNGGQR